MQNFVKGKTFDYQFNSKKIALKNLLAEYERNTPSQIIRKLLKAGLLYSIWCICSCLSLSTMARWLVCLSTALLIIV